MKSGPLRKTFPLMRVIAIALFAMSLPARSAATKPASRTVFIGDATGSMVDLLPFMKTEVTKRANLLTDPQEFNVLILQNQKVLAFRNPSNRTVKASKDAKKQLGDWINGFLNEGPGEPLEAIKLARAAGADSIVMISDFDSQIDLPKELKLLNKPNPVPIHAIFLTDGSGDTEAKREDFAKRVAADSGGRFERRATR